MAARKGRRYGIARLVYAHSSGRCLVVGRHRPRRRLVLAHPKQAVRCLGPMPGAPSRHKRARDRRVGEVDGNLRH